MTDFTMPRGDTFFIDHTVTSAGSPYDLTGKSLRFVAKRAVGDPDSAAVFVKTSPSGGVAITNPTQGLARTTIAPADTSGLAAVAHALRWELQVTDPTPNPDAVYTVDKGYLLVDPDVAVTTP